jgi:hypothetical protein
MATHLQKTAEQIALQHMVQDFIPSLIQKENSEFLVSPALFVQQSIKESCPDRSTAK